MLNIYATYFLKNRLENKYKTKQNKQK